MNFFRARNYNQAFTLIEILIVIALIGVTSVLIFGAIGRSTTRSQNEERIAGMQEVELALGRYFLSHRYYPEDLDVLVDQDLLNDLPAAIADHYRYTALNLPGGSQSSVGCSAYHLGVELAENQTDMGDDFNAVNSSVNPCVPGQNKFDGRDFYDSVQPQEIIFR